MIELNVVLLILIAHFIGDFLLQNDDMAINKSKNIHILYVHCMAYIIPFLIWTIFKPGAGMLMWWFINMHLHFLIDFITSRITSKLWAKNERHWFFTVIGADQLLHLMILFVTYNILVK